MADNMENKAGHNYYLDVPPASCGFFLKCMDHVDWGMKNRLARMFNPTSGRTVMLAFDHGYIMGSTAGLERIDIVIPPLANDVDVLMGTRGALRAAMPPMVNKAIALRCSAGSSVLDEDMSHEVVGVDIEDAIRMNATCMAIQTFIGAPGEKTSIQNLCNTVDAGNRYGIPTLGVIAVGKEMERTTQYFLLAPRMVAEFGAQIIKTYYCDEFEKITSACPVPIVIAGGKKLPENEALTLCFRAIQEGAAGVDMGRNIFQSEYPRGMVKAVAKVVHENASDKEAYDFYLSLKTER